MAEIIKLITKEVKAKCTNKISNELIRALYRLCPDNVRWSYLFHAQHTFNDRQDTDKKRWLDLLTVYVGLPDWVKNEEDLQLYDLPYVKVPMGFIEDLFDCSSIEINLAMPHIFEAANTEESLRAIIHCKSLEFIRKCNELDRAIFYREGKFQFKHNYYEKFILNAEENFESKSQLVLELVSEDREGDEAVEVVWIALSFAYGLSIGRHDLLNFFKRKFQNPMSQQEAEVYFSNLTVEDFYQWSCDYFVMHAYFETLEDLKVILKISIEEDENDLRIFEYARQLLKRTKILN